MYSLACQVRIVVGDSDLCCCGRVTSFELWLPPLVVGPQSSVRNFGSFAGMTSPDDNRYVYSIAGKCLLRGLSATSGRPPALLNIVLSRFFCFFFSIASTLK